MINYIQKFTRLSANKNRSHWTAVSTHRAPHKPLLLLSVIDLFAQGHIHSNLIELDDELMELFGLYWRAVNPPSLRGDITMPFFYLRSEGFWHLLPQPGQEAILAAKRRTDGLKQLRELVLGARLDEALYQLLQDENSRSLLRTTLIQTYFAPEIHQRLLDRGQMNAQAFQYSMDLLQKAKEKTAKEAPEEPYSPAVRDQGFRRVIVTIYEHRCAFCGVRILTADGHTAIEAAHIIPWAISQNDDPRNGLALCRLCHWSFDEGLVTLSSSYQIKISPQLTIPDNIPGHLSAFGKRPFLGPTDHTLWPFPESIIWHQQTRFRSR
ncbi:MAG: HNH endonuclease [Chloroflexota bacterium]